MHPNQLSAARTMFPQIEKIRAIVSRPENSDVLVIQIELRPNTEEEGLTEKIIHLAQQAARLRVDRVDIVPAGTIPADSKPIVDERKWD